MRAKVKRKATKPTKSRARTRPTTRVVARTSRRIVAPSTRMYASARPTRLQMGFGSGGTNWSEDSELASSLTMLRVRARTLIRDASYAKRARTVVINNVVGSGIGLQALVMSSRSELRDAVNDEIEYCWEKWCAGDSCHTGGALHFADLERLCLGEIFETGEIFIRKHLRPFGSSKVPFALEVIEPERIVDDLVSIGAPNEPANQYRLGVEMDSFYRPQAYWIRSRHPSETRFNTLGQVEQVERVPADEIYHLRIVDRWPQTRGVPWLHTAALRLHDMDTYSEAEITAARGAACYMATIETPDESGMNAIGTEDEDGNVNVELEPGLVPRLRPGEKLNPYMPGRPNTALDPFMRYMLREVASGANISYESLSRDYSQSNYSSSRLSLLDDRDTWRALQLWFIRAFRTLCHRDWMRQAVLSRAITTIGVVEYISDPDKFLAARFKPRGWSWIDPEKEVAALEKAVRNGFTTMSDVIAATGEGDDFEDKIKRRARELKMSQAEGLAFDTDPVPPVDAAKNEATVTVAESRPPPQAAPPQPPPRAEPLKTVGGTR